MVILLCKIFVNFSVPAVPAPPEKGNAVSTHEQAAMTKSIYIIMHISVNHNRFLKRIFVGFHKISSCFLEGICP
jgi:hypothetical protein